MKHLDLLNIISDVTPRVHATGFAQLYISKAVRLHVWTDALFAKAPDPTQVAFYHDHRYGIVSHVLRGALLDSPVYPIINNSWDGEQWQVWEVRPAGEGQPDKPQHAGLGATVRQHNPRVIRAGFNYYIPKRTFHASRALETTVTVMRKQQEEGAWARLLVPTGFDPIHSLTTQPDREWLRSIFWNECRKLTESDLAIIDYQIKTAAREGANV